MADFIATESGNSASGYLIANGNVYPAVSGGPKFRDIPQGTYNYGNKEHPKGSQWTMTDAPNKAAGAAAAKNFWKYHIGPDKDGGGTIHDDRSFTTPEGNSFPNGGEREGVDFHFDGGRPGTAGCIGFQDKSAVDGLDADPTKTVTVKYLADDAAVKAAVEDKLKRCIDWSKVKAPEKPGGGGSGGGVQSQTKKGKKVQKGHTTVRVGKKHREIAHKQAMLMGGGFVVEGSATVFVGPEHYAVSHIEHMTTDGSPIATGEDTVMLT